MITKNVKQGDIVQLNNNAPKWFGALVIVTEVKVWGVQGFMPMPQEDEIGEAYVRVPWDQFELTGGKVEL